MTVDELIAELSEYRGDMNVNLLVEGDLYPLDKKHVASISTRTNGDYVRLDVDCALADVE